MFKPPLTGRAWRWRALVLSFVLLLAATTAVVLPAALAGNANAGSSAGTTAVKVLRSPEVRLPNKSDVSAPLGGMTPRMNPSLLPPDVGPENPVLGRKLGPAGVDSVVQRLLGPLVMPAPIQNFEGQYNQYGPVPPDTNGDVGRNHYVQIVNSGFTIYDKSGTLLYGPTNNNVLFTGFGGLCETTNAGDPVALYDSMADRWVMNWFAFTTQAGPSHQCIAVSTSPDPLGSYYRYDFTVNPAGFEDYPHMTVWPDAYYMTSNTFNNGANTAGNFAFDRAKMLRGDPTAAVVIFRLQGDGGMLSTNFEGSTLPPAGSPNYFYELTSLSPGALGEFKFHVDFVTPANSTFTGPITIPVADYNTTICGATRERCIPQPGTTALLEALDDRLMYRVEYRNFGGYESIVLNHTVNSGAPSPNGTASPRWYELRSPNTTPTVFQQGTYAPADGLHRWVGSIAQDRVGDIAMGFSVSSATLFPSIRYAGRVLGDPPGTFGQGEATLLAGTGSEDFLAAPRWGDYSSISVDPADDCTFWYTTEYFSQTGLRDWRTRIGSFKFANCSALGTPTPVASPTGAVPTVTNTPGPVPTICPGGISMTDSITNTNSLTQTGRLGLGDPKSSCLVAQPLPAVSDNFTRHFKSYTYTNSTANPQCVTVSITQDCGNNAIQSIAYLGSYNPNSIQTNYLAHGGASGHSFSYGFTLPAGGTAVVVVAEVSPNLGCATYQISISPCAPAATSTPAAATNTPAPTATPAPPSATPTVVCTGTTYQTFPSTGAALIPATNDIGNHCDDCNTTVTLPFPVTVYGQVYTSTNAGSNGILDFGSNQANIYTANCLPVRSNPPPFTATLFPYYDDLRTDVVTATHGIYSATLGVAPNRQFVLEWHATYFISDTLETNFEVVMNENSPVLSVIYGQTGTEAQGANPASGIQLNLGQYTAYSCHTDLPAGLEVDYVPIACGVTPSPTPAPPTSTATSTPVVTSTSTPAATETPCPITFTDVPIEYWAFGYIKWAACHGIISGYADGSFHPEGYISRAQIAKEIVLAAGFPLISPPTPTFSDVAPTFWAYSYIETANAHGVMQGYADGTFHPRAYVTRAQIAKIIVVARGYTVVTPGTPDFVDVAPDYWAYSWIETAFQHQVVGGYNCFRLTPTPTPAPPCLEYRPANLATRAQFSKILFQAYAVPHHEAKP